MKTGPTAVGCIERYIISIMLTSPSLHRMPAALDNQEDHEFPCGQSKKDLDKGFNYSP